MDGALVQNIGFGATGLHHHTPTYCVKWIRYNTRNRCDSLCKKTKKVLVNEFSISQINRETRDTHLCDTPRNKEWRLFGIWQHTTGSVIETEVGSTVNDNTLNGYSEAAVQSGETVSLEDLAQAIAKT